MTGRRFIAFAAAIVVAGLAARILAGAAKADFHVDEGITLAITNGTWKPPVVEPLFDRWMAKGELEELAFNANRRAAGRVDAKGIALTTARDVHPPLFYWLFALARIVVGPGRHVAAALLLNGLCFVATSACVAFMVLRANRGSPAAARGVALVALAIFSFSSASVALTSFMRMYELLQAACLSFACLATLVLYPRAGGKAGPFAIAGLAAVSCLGALTHYHFLMFAFFVSATCAVILLSRLRVADALWCALSCAVGLYAAWRIFPDMRSHLIGSDRALEGVAFASSVLSGEVGGFLFRARGYVLLVIRYVPALAAAAALGLLGAIVTRAERRTDGPSGDPTGAVRAEFPSGFYALLAVPCAGIFLAVSATTPFLSLRYVASYVPAVAVVAAAATCRVFASLRSRKLRAVAAALSLCAIAVPLALPMPAFHDEYATDRSPAYFSDDAPVIVVSDRRGFVWKNMLPYLAIPRHKRVYVTMRYDGNDLAESLLPALRSSGSAEAYAMVDALFPDQPSLERVGFYGFFAVYRVTLE